MLAGLVLVGLALSPSQAGDRPNPSAPIAVAPVPYEPNAPQLNGYAHGYRQELEQNFGQDPGHQLEQNRGMETDGPALVTMNFQDVEIQVLARFISEITHKNFILDEKVRGKVTIISPTQVSPSDLVTT